MLFSLYRIIEKGKRDDFMNEEFYTSSEVEKLLHMQKSSDKH